MDERTSTIGSLAEASGVSVDALRYYERIGIVFDVDRLANGHRRYRPWHLRWLRFVTCLRAAGMPVAELRRYADLVRRGDVSLGDRIAMLEDHRDAVRAKMRELGTHLETIERKIEMYHRGACRDDRTPAAADGSEG